MAIRIVDINQDTVLEPEMWDSVSSMCQLASERVVPVIPGKSMFGEPGPATDAINEIPWSATSRYLPPYTVPPYDTLDRILLLHDDAFLIATVQPETVRYDRNLDPYEATKYQMVYENLSHLDDPETTSDEVAMIWIEVVCVRSQHRGGGIGRALIRNLESQVRERFSSTPTVIIGLDAPGTRNRWQNAELKRFYERLGYSFLPIGTQLSGNQIGFKIFRRVREPERDPDRDGSERAAESS